MVVKNKKMPFQKGINWDGYPSFFKRGSYIQRKRVLTKFSSEELEKLTTKTQARINPDLEIERWVIDRVDLQNYQVFKIQLMLFFMVKNLF
jgi:hypothetical protein